MEYEEVVVPGSSFGDEVYTEIESCDLRDCLEESGMLDTFRGLIEACLNAVVEIAPIWVIRRKALPSIELKCATLAHSTPLSRWLRTRWLRSTV